MPRSPSSRFPTTGRVRHWPSALIGHEASIGRPTDETHRQTHTPDNIGRCARGDRRDHADLEAISVETRVSGDVMQAATTDRLILPIVDLIVYLSQGMTLKPGDIIATGTPGPVGDSRVPPRYLRDGDVVEVTVSGVGTLRNPVHFEGR
jgi:Fumarylacetoacetate (FAA) hydrolase family